MLLVPISVRPSLFSDNRGGAEGTAEVKTAYKERADTRDIRELILKVSYTEGQG